MFGSCGDIRHRPEMHDCGSSLPSRIIGDKNALERYMSLPELPQITSNGAPFSNYRSYESMFNSIKERLGEEMTNKLKQCFRWITIDVLIETCNRLLKKLRPEQPVCFIRNKLTEKYGQKFPSTGQDFLEQLTVYLARTYNMRNQFYYMYYNEPSVNIPSGTYIVYLDDGAYSGVLAAEILAKISLPELSVHLGTASIPAVAVLQGNRRIKLDHGSNLHITNRMVHFGEVFTDEEVKFLLKELGTSELDTYLINMIYYVKLRVGISINKYEALKLMSFTLNVLRLPDNVSIPYFEPFSWIITLPEKVLREAQFRFYIPPGALLESGDQKKVKIRHISEIHKR